MSSKFFNNIDKTLFAKLKGIADNMSHFDQFLAVTGFFRSSGYFKLRGELGNVKKMKLLVGINIDDVFLKFNKKNEFRLPEEQIRKLYGEDFKRDFLDADYVAEIEGGISQMCEDLRDGRLEIRIYGSKNLHAKFYLCLPDEPNEHTDGWVIMGSSNLSDAGLGISTVPHYELNVAMKDYDDLKYCYDQFLDLWEESLPLTIGDVEKYMEETYLGQQPTPYEIYMKVLISVFGDQVEDDFTLKLPEGILDLKYQKDAAIQGYQIMNKHDGVFIADVVGLGKTIIATMMAKRFIEENGRNTKVLVVCPPALVDHWESTFKDFNIEKKYAKFISNCSLSKVLDEREDFNLIIVDEAHGFRRDESDKYDALQMICKAPCEQQGTLKLRKKKVVLLSATPINNSPEDLQNLLLLFQDGNVCTIDGVPNIRKCFAPWIKRYNNLMAERHIRRVTDDVDKLYAEIREKVIDKVTIRRTRNNILNSPDYSEDLEKQKITFPKVEKPQVQTYNMNPSTSELFYRTMRILSMDEDDALTYARYRAVEFLKKEYWNKTYPKNIGDTLKGIYRVHMVKRLESSFYAFKKSLQTFLNTTESLIQMFEDNNILIVPDLKVSELMEQGFEFDQILEKAAEKGYTKEEVSFKADNFQPEYLDMLYRDRDILKELIEDWKKETGDPKFDTFRKGLEKEFYEDNESKKLVIFSESVDTLNYLYERLTKEIGMKDVLEVTSIDRKDKDKLIKENFDANYDVQKDNYNIILTSDVLAEGVNLHRSNVVINYDSPWNAIRLMQRVGRVNRIGSKAKKIYNYMFYPSQQGEDEIGLYANALIKLQSFHSAYGEDAQIYSVEEIVKDFKLFDSNVEDSVDDRLKFLREARELYNSSPDLYEKIKHLPLKSRVMRESQKHSGKTIVYLQSNVKTEFYEIKDNTPKEIDFIAAAKILKAEPEEKPVPFNSDQQHYTHVKEAMKKFSAACESLIDTPIDSSSKRDSKLTNRSNEAKNFLNSIKRELPDDKALHRRCDALMLSIERGTHNKLPKEINSLKNKNKITTKELFIEHKDLINNVINRLYEKYGSGSDESKQKIEYVSDPEIIVSETFV